MSTTAKKNKQYYLSLLFIILTVIFWGISFISTKIILKELPPSSIAFFRQIIALVPLTAALFITKSFQKIPIRHFLLIAASGFFGIVLYFVFENTGIKYTTASNASIIVAAVPVFTLISEILFFKMRPNFRVLLCIITSIVGVYMVISVNGRMDFTSSTLYGNLLVIGAMGCWVVYTIMNKGLGKQYTTLVLIFYQTLAGAILFIPFTVAEIPQWRVLSFTSLLHLIYLGVFCSALSYFMYVYASKRLGAAISSAFLNLIPVVSVAAGILVLDETLTLLQMLGMITIIASLYVISKNERINQQEKMG